MSSQKSSSQTKYANSNLNGVFAKPSAAPGGVSTGAAINRYSGMLVLQKRTRTGPVGKLAVPKPVNLPSIKKEHAGNDPTTQLVPAGSGTGGWNKPEEAPAVSQPEISRPAALTAGSTWASQPRAGGAAWQPSVAAPAPKPTTFPGDRGLNPEEYPSLAATAKPQSASIQRPGTKPSYDQDSRTWTEDERAPPASYRPQNAEWSAREGDRFDDERYVGDRPTEYVGRPAWDQGYRDRPARYDYDLAFPPPRAAAVDDDYDFTRGRGYNYESYGSQGAPPPYDPPPPPPRRSAGPGDRFSDPYDRPEKHEGRFDPYDDRTLFPPPPPPRQPPPPVRDVQHSEQSEEEDPERAAFEAELERVAAEMEKRKAEAAEGISEHRPLQEALTSEEPEEVAVEETFTTVAEVEFSNAEKDEFVPMPPVPPPPPKPPKITLLSRSVAKEAEEEEERRRKEAAAEKLRRLEQQIAAREAQTRKVVDAEDGAASDWEDDKAQEVEYGVAVRLEEQEDVHGPEAPAPVKSIPPPPPPPLPPVESALPKHVVNSWQQPSGMPLTARFGSFDEGLLEELTRSGSDDSSTRTPWNPDPVGPSPLSQMVPPPPPPPPPPQSSKVLPNDVTQDAVVPPPMQKDNLLSRSAESAAAAAIQAAESSMERRSREARTGRGAGRFGRGGRRNGAAALETEKAPATAPGEFRRSAERERPSKVPPQDPSGSGSTEFGRGRGRASRGAGRGRGRNAPGGRDSHSGVATPDTKGSSTPGEPAEGEGVAVEAAVAALDAGFIEVKSKRTMRQSRDAAVAATSVTDPRPPVNKAPGRSEKAALANTSAPVAGRPVTPDTSANDAPAALTPPLPTAVAARSAPQNIPGTTAAGSTGGSYNWSATLAKDVANLTLDEPLSSGGVNLPVSLDPTPPKPAGPIANPIFQRQMAPGRVQPNLPDNSLDVLGNGMPPLPADLNLDMPSPPKPSGLNYQPVAVPSMPMPSTIRPLGPGYFPRPDSSNTVGVGAGNSSLNMWGQPHPIPFGQHPQPSMPHHQAQTASNLQQAVESFYSAGPSMFPNNAQSRGVATSSPASLQPQGPPPLMLNMGQFGQFQSFGPPFPPVGQFGALGSGFFAQQPPFLPTGKQPDWSTGPGTSLNTGLGPHPLGRPSSLDIPAMAPHGFAMAGGPNAGDSQGFPGVSHQLVGQGALPSLGPNTFPPPPKQNNAVPSTMKLMPGVSNVAVGALGPQQVNLGKDAGPKRADLPDDIFPLEPASSTKPQLNMGSQSAPPPPPRGGQPPPPPPPVRDTGAKGAPPQVGRGGGRSGGRAVPGSSGSRAAAVVAAAVAGVAVDAPAAVSMQGGPGRGGGRGGAPSRMPPSGQSGAPPGMSIKSEQVMMDAGDKGMKLGLGRGAGEGRGSTSSSGGRGRGSVGRGGGGGGGGGGSGGRGRRGQSGATLMYVPKSQAAGGAGGESAGSS